MSIFTKYFNALAWPLAHERGVLQAIIRGLALDMDKDAASMVVLRDQFVPGRSDDIILPHHGTSRGIYRHPSETDAMYRDRVAHALAFHAKGGKQIGFMELLRFFGFQPLEIQNLRHWSPARWAEFGVCLADSDLTLERLKDFLFLANEYKPARSVLSRIYNPGYDLRPALYSLSDFGNCLYSGFSGVHADVLGPEFDHDLLISLGYKHSAQASRSDAAPPAFAGVLNLVFVAYYVDRPVYSLSRYGQKFLPNHSFITSQLASYKTKEPRRFWSMLPTTKYKSSAYYSEAGDDFGRFSSINATYSTKRRTITHRPAVYGQTMYSDSVDSKEVVIEEHFDRSLAVLAKDNALGQTPFSAAFSLATGAASSPLHHQGWDGRWDDRIWDDYLGYVAINNEEDTAIDAFYAVHGVSKYSQSHYGTRR